MADPVFDPKAFYVITVEGDVNDADYVSKRSTLDGDEMAKIVSLLKRVCKGGHANKWRANWDTACHRVTDIHPKDMHGLTDMEFEMLEDMMPRFEGRTIHTLESVTVEPAVTPLWTWTGKE